MVQTNPQCQFLLPSTVFRFTDCHWLEVTQQWAAQAVALADGCQWMLYPVSFSCHVTTSSHIYIHPYFVLHQLKLHLDNWFSINCSEKVLRNSWSDNVAPLSLHQTKTDIKSVINGIVLVNENDLLFLYLSETLKINAKIMKLPVHLYHIEHCL